MSGVLTNDYYLRQFNHPGDSAQGAIVAAMPAGSLVGALAVTQLGDRLGRKKTIMLAALIWIVGSVLQCASVNRGMLVAGRVIAGLSVGISSAVVPIYQSEITAPAIRGRLVSLQQWSITWGILIQYFIQFGCSDIQGVASFRIPWGLQMIPAIVLFFECSSSPNLLILADLHGKGDKNNELVRLEFEEIKEQVLFERNEGAKSYSTCSKLTGMNVMMYYITYVFRGIGLVGRRAGLIAASVQYVLNVAMTVPAILYIDKWGRRPMLIAGLTFMGFFLFLVGGLQGRLGEWDTIEGERTWVIKNHDSATKGIIVLSYLFVCSFAVTMGPVSWTYPAEIYSLKVRAKAVSLATATNWIFNFALAWAVPPGFSSIAYKTYFIFGTFNFAGCIHVIFMYPETVGRTLEEVEDIFAAGHAFSAWKIGKNVGKRTLEDVEKSAKHTVVHKDSASIDEKA
ncbi:high affinity glucose transporter [Paramarasmius palmivorus]|uniref:High affinity glucose transporter n=1 Tax=Paramarasmius palmivorus TaxID=297713 RepID=A0AAW0B6P3_9AGAR